MENINADGTHSTYNVSNKFFVDENFEYILSDFIIKFAVGGFDMDLVKTIQINLKDKVWARIFLHL